MSWVDILKKDDKEFVKPVIVKEKQEEDVIEEYCDPCYKDADDEFEYKYSDKVTNIVIDFDDFLRKNFLPFNDKCVLDKTYNCNYNFHDFIKVYSKEYEKICKYVTEYNNDIDREIEEENKKYEEEQEELENNI